MIFCVTHAKKMSLTFSPETPKSKKEENAMARPTLGQSAALVLGLLVMGCSSAPTRALVVKSDPAEVDVCIKGKSTSKYFYSAKASCVGKTPLDISGADVWGPDGKKHHVNFGDVDVDREEFYLILSRPGYAPKSLPVPSWDQFANMKHEDIGNAAQQTQTHAPAPVAPQNPAPAEPGTTPTR
jgi:hypothetical protein